MRRNDTLARRYADALGLRVLVSRPDAEVRVQIARPGPHANPGSVSAVLFECVGWPEAAAYLRGYGDALGWPLEQPSK